MRELPKKNRFIEEYKNLHCSTTAKQDFVFVTIMNNGDNDFSDLFKILNKYKNTTIEIRNINSLKELNKLCDILSVCDYSGNIIINLISRINGKASIKGLINNKFINLEELPNYVKINGFYKDNNQSDFTSWAHNLNINNKNTLMSHLTEEDKYIFSEQEKVIRSFYVELVDACPEIMTYDEKTRFEKVFMYVKNNFLYANVIDIDGYVRTGFEYTHDAVETYKRREGVCNGRSNLLTLVTNNNLLKCNSAVVDGYTEPGGIHPHGLAHTWNVFVDRNGNAYYYDLSFSNFNRREVHDVGRRRIDRVYYSNVQEIMDRPLLPPRRELNSQVSQKVKLNRPLPPRRKEQ